ncbi:hypothetical protein ACLESD_54130, partial [Pyxidicoccus sp. 3LFB2]
MQGLTGVAAIAGGEQHSV